MSSNIRGFPSERHDHATFEERRGSRVENLKKELIRDNLFDPRKLDNVPYYYSVDEQNLFLNSIENTQFGKSLIGIQYRFNKEMGIPLILPKFSDISNISIKEQQFLALQGIEIGKDRQGRYSAGMGQGARIFKNIEVTGGKSGAYYQFIEPSEYYISIGAVPPEFLREIEVHGAVSGTGFQRGRGYVGDEPEITTSQVEPQVVVEKPFDKPDYRGTQPEPEITTDHIEPPVEAEPEKLYEVYGQTLPLSESAVDYYESLGVSVTTSQVEPPVEEVTEPITSQVEPPVEEVTEPITSQVDPPGQEVTAQISWFGNTWFPWHLELEDRRRR